MFQARQQRRYGTLSFDALSSCAHWSLATTWSLLYHRN
jgi:hypothetical protein